MVPILRAGLGMLEGMIKLIPTAEVGFLGMVRNEETLQPDIYAERLPDDLTDRQCFVLDPMLATGGSLHRGDRLPVRAGRRRCHVRLPDRRARRVSRPSRRRRRAARSRSCSGALDEKLNEVGYIVPGLGDAGDRLYGTV